MKYWSTIFAFILLAPALVYAQQPERLMPAELHGEVVEAASGQPLAGVRVGIEYVGELYEEPPTAAMTTGDDGAFSFQNVPPGPYRVELEAPEFIEQSARVDLGSGESVEAIYRLAKLPINLRGEVREAGTRKPLAAVRVSVSDAESGEVVRSAYTDSQAAFSFRGLEAGTYRIAIAADGYETLEVDEEIVDGQVTRGTFYLEAEYYDEFTVKTTAKREQTEISRERISLDELKRIPGSGGDVVRVVQNMPGVARPSYTSGSLIVRGAAPQDTQVFLQGDSIPLVYHFLGGPAVLNSEMIEAVDFFPGNFSTYYGRATGGIVELQTRSPREDRFHGFTEVDVLDATVQIEGPIGEDFSFALSGRRSYIDTILPYVLPEEAKESVTVSPRYYDYQSWLTWRGADDHTVELFIYGSDDQVATLFESSQPIGTPEVQITGVEFENSFHRGQIRWKWTPSSEPVENELMISFGRNRTGFRAAENLHFTGDYYQTQIREDFQVRASEEFRFRVGADMQMGVVDYGLELPPMVRDREIEVAGGQDSQLNSYEDGVIGEDRLALMRPAFYVEGSWRPVEALQLVPGVRLDYFGDIKDMSLSPRFNARYKALDGLTLEGGVGLFTQPPLPGEADDQLGNTELTYEEAIHYALGGEWQILEHVELDTTFFYRDLSSLTHSTSDVQLEADGDRVEDLVYDNEGEGRAYGLELLLRHYPEDKFFGWIAYTLSRAERWDPLEQVYHPFEFDQTHILTSVAGYNLPWGLDLSARFRLVTGTPYTPVAGSVFDADNEQYVNVYGPRLSARNATFHQLDARLDKRFVFDTFMLGVYVEVLNAYNAVNEEGRQYSYDATESAPVPGLPIIPTLGMNGRF